MAIPCFFIAFRFLLLLIRSLYQEGTLFCLLIRRFAASIHSKHFAQIKPALFSKEIYNIYMLHVIMYIHVHSWLYITFMLLLPNTLCMEVFLCMYQYYVIHTTMQYYILLLYYIV